MIVAVIFEGDPEQPDPQAGHPEGVVRGEFIPRDADCLVIWREWGEQFEGGSRTHVVGGGAWENLGEKAIRRIRKSLVSL